MTGAVRRTGPALYVDSRQKWNHLPPYAPSERHKTEITFPQIHGLSI
jgi:hypothetical protein